MRVFERQLVVDVPRNLGRLDGLVNSDLGKHRVITKYKEDIEALQIKWNKNKLEFQNSGNTNKAVLINNSLG